MEINDTAQFIKEREERLGSRIRYRTYCTWYARIGHEKREYGVFLYTDGRTMAYEDFDREKLRRGIEKACWKRNIRPEQIDTLLSKIVMEIETEYDREISSVEIGTKAMAALRQLDKVAYVRFASVYRDFKDIEEFISEIRTIGAKKR